MKKSESGFLLIEALVALLIFSFAVLALIALQGVVIREIGEAKYRMEAAMHADRLLGQMWASSKATLATDFASPSGARFTTWSADVTDPVRGGLPGAVTTPPTVVFAGANQVTVTISWQRPGVPVGTPFHTYVTTTQIQ